MDNLFTAFREAIYNYMNVDELPPRLRNNIKDAHAKNYYSMDRVDRLVEPSMPSVMPEEGMEE